jgi:alpha-tubulin suppressor-like RCC1 family protein
MTRKPCLALTFLVPMFLHSAAAHSQTPDPLREDIKRLIVRIVASLPSGSEDGAGIVIGADDDHVYIVTANHVVRVGDQPGKDILVQFRCHTEKVLAQLATHYSIDQDLAVITVANAKAHGIDGNAFPFDRLGDPTILGQGDPVFLAGHPQGVLWSITVSPDAFVEADGDSLRFESKSLFRGHSGGALLNFRMEIVGLLRRDEQPNGDALSIASLVSTLKAWGYPVKLRQRFEVAGLEALSAGGGHTCFVNKEGVASCWGDNSRGQLGDGTTTSTSQPSTVSGRRTFVSISAGLNHTCGVTPSAQVLCWGDNSSGQLGGMTSADEDDRSRSPVAVSGGLSFAAVSAGEDHTCGLTTTGAAYCWGDNGYGQLGNGTKVSSPNPVPVTGGYTFRSVRAGVLFSCGITDAGSAYCWGANSFGRLGNGSQVDSSLPVPVSGNLKFAAVSAGDGHACGVTTDGKSYCWGDNDSGQIGLAGGKSSPVPVPIAGGLTFASISAGRRTTYALTRNGTAYSWGSGIDVLSVSNEEVSATLPGQIFGTQGLRFKLLSTSFTHACGQTTAGEVYCWGSNKYGQLGNGSNDETVRPTLVSPR